MTTPLVTETRRHGQPLLAERFARSDIGFTGTGVPVALNDTERCQLDGTSDRAGKR
jgi:hypothetical protein